jgi:osmoprotectant transport system ATP-binding protein
MIAFDGVTKRYPDGTVAVDHLSFEAPSGKITVLVGPSGCGKTTSLRMINRMIKPTSGAIMLDGRDTPDEGVRAATGHRLRHPARGPVPPPHGP